MAVEHARRALALVALALALTATPGAAQPPARSTRNEAAEAFAEMLRRTDPEAHARFVGLQDSRDRSLAELLRAQDRYRAGGPELRALTTPPLRAARRQYAADARAFLDFLDERDRKTLEDYRKAMAQIDGLIEERRKAREELDALTRE